MQRYIAVRLLQFIPVIFSVSVIIFFLLRILPGDVARLIVMGPEGSGIPDPARIEQVRKDLGLDQPLYMQYVDWIRGLFSWKLGHSYWSDEPVGEIVRRTLPVTLQLVMLTVVLSLSISLPLGLFAAIRQGTPLDHILRIVSVAGMTLPTFWTGTLVLLGLVLLFSWSPPLEFAHFWDDPGSSFRQLIWPALVLGFWFAAPLSRLTRSSMLEVLRQDYVRTAWSKGLRERSVITRHALKNALLPVVTLAGIQTGRMLGGSVVVESVFGLPGLGRTLVHSVIYQDFLLVQAIVLLVAVFFMVTSLAVDLFYSWIDPRIRYQ